jgi:hypothetical protein
LVHPQEKCRSLRYVRVADFGRDDNICIWFATAFRVIYMATAMNRRRT